LLAGWVVSVTYSTSQEAYYWYESSNKPGCRNSFCFGGGEGGDTETLINVK